MAISAFNSNLSKVPQYLHGHLAMLTYAALVAGSFSLGSIVANEIAPTAISAVRFSLATLVMGAVTFCGPGFKRSHFSAPWRYLILGGLQSFYFVCMFVGLKTASPVSSAAVFTLIPLLSGAFAFILLRQIMSIRMAMALILAAIGAIWVILRGDLQALKTFKLGQGELIYLYGCIIVGIYTPMIPKLNRGESAITFTFGTLFAGSFLLIIISYNDIRMTDWFNLPTMVWLTLGYLVIFSTAISFVLLQFAAMRLPSAKVMAYTYLTPVWVILWEVLIGNGLPQSYVIPGVLLTICALFILMKNEKKDTS